MLLWRRISGCVALWSEDYFDIPILDKRENQRMRKTGSMNDEAQHDSRVLLPKHVEVSG